MAMQKKTKVSFDIDSNLLKRVKEFCLHNKLKLSDFYREAIKEKLELEKNYMEILVMSDKGIDKYLIERFNYDITMWEADEDMMGLLSAEMMGTIKLKEDCQKDSIPPKLLEDLKKKGTLHFFTKNTPLNYYHQDLESS